MKNYILISCLLFGITTSFSQNKVEAPKPVLTVSSANQLVRQEMELCAFIHFTTNTFTDLEHNRQGRSETDFQFYKPFNN